MALLRERLLLEVEAKSTGDDEITRAAEAVDDLGRATDETGQSAKKFNSAMGGMKSGSAAVRKQIEAIAKDFEGLAYSMGSIDLAKFAEQVPELEQAQKAIDGLAKRAAALSQGMTELAAAEQGVIGAHGGLSAASAEAAESMDTVSKAAGAAQQAAGGFARLVDVISGVIHILQALSDPERLRNIATLLTIMAAFARLRGFGELGDQLSYASMKVTDFADTMQEMREGGGVLEYIGNRAKVVNAAFEAFEYTLVALATAASAFVAVGLVRSFQNLAVATSNLAASTPAMAPQMKATAEGASKAAKATAVLTRAFGDLVRGLGALKMGAGIFDDLGSIIGTVLGETASGLAAVGPRAKAAADATKGAASAAGAVASASKAAAGGLGQMGSAFRFVAQKAEPLNEMAKLSFFKQFTTSARSIIASAGEIAASLTSVVREGGKLNGLGRMIAGAFKDGFGQTARDAQVLAGGMKGLAQTAAAQLKPSILGLAEAGSILGPILTSVGAAALTSESKLVKFSGAAAIAAGVFLGGFATAVTLALSLVGDFAQAIGYTLFDAMARFEEKFRDLQKSMAQFTFVIQGFGRELGEGISGSVDHWTSELERMRQSTQFTRAEIAKSIKLLVAEGSSIGLSVEQTTRLLGTAADVAAGHGRELEEVTNAIVKGMVGQGQMLQAMGVDLSEASLGHSHYVHELGKAVDKMSEAEKVQARYATILEKTTPLLGAAANELNTVAGAQKRLSTAIDEVQARLGQQGVFSMWLRQGLANLATAFLQLPTGVTVAMGVTQDFLSVLLIGLGTVLKYLVGITSLVTGYQLLKTVVASNVLVQRALTKAFIFLAVPVKANVVAVTSLSAAMANLRAVIAGGVIMTVKSIGAALAGLAAKVWAVTAAVLKSPILWGAAAIASTVFALGAAIREMTNEVKFISDALYGSADAQDAANKANKQSISIWGELVKIASTVWTVFKNLARVLVGGVMVSLFSVGKAVLWVRKQFADGAEVKEFENRIKAMDEKLRQLSVFTVDSMKNIGKAFGGTAIAAESAAKGVKKATDTLKDFQKANQESSKAAAEAFDPGRMRASVLGDEYQKAAAAAEEASVKYGRIRSARLNGEMADVKDAAEQETRARVEAAQAYLNMTKVRQDAIKKFADKSTEYAQEELKNQNKLVEAEKLAGAARLAEFDKEVQSARKSIGLSKAQQEELAKTRKQLEAYNASALEKARIEQDQKTQDRALDALDGIRKATKDVRLETAKLGATKLQLIGIEEDLAREEAARVAQELYDVGALTDARKAELRAYLDAQRAKAQAARDAITGGSPMAGAIIDATEIATQGMTKMAQPMLGVVGAANAALDAAQGIVDAIPGLLDKAAGLLKSITNFGPTLAKSFKGFVQEIPRLVQNMVPNLLKGAMDILFAAVDQLLIKLPNAFFNLLSEGIPKAFESLFDRLPDLIQKLAFGLITFAPKIVVAIINFIIRGVPRIIKAFVKMIPVLVQALVQGIIEAFKNIGQLLAGLFTGNFPDMGIEEGAKKLVSTIAGSSSELFKVVEDEAIKRGAEKAQEVAKAIDWAIQRLFNILKMLWNALVDLLRGVWLWIWENILQPIVELVQRAWQWVWDNVIQPIVTVVQQAWQWVYDTVVLPLYNFIISAWQWVYDNVVLPLATAIQTAWRWVYDNVVAPLVNAGSAIAEGLINYLWDVWDTIKGFGERIGQGFFSWLNDGWDRIKEYGNRIGMGFFAWLNDGWDRIKEYGWAVGQGFFKWINDAWDSLKNIGSGMAQGFFDALYDAWDWLVEFFGSVIPGGGGGGDGSGGYWNPANWGNKGGIIPTYAANGTFVDWVPKGVDTVPAMLQPGEFVVSKAGVNSVGADFLDAVNTGRFGMTGTDGGGTTISITNHFDIKTTKPVDAELIDREIVPRIEEKLRRASIDGRRVISPKGVQK